MIQPDDTYRTIAEPSTGLYREKGSKFIALATPVSTEDMVRNTLEALREEYHDARHHCYAYIIGAKGDRWRLNDDGEPSGTAGKPIHGQLLSFNLTNALVVVVRYFGGTKLGVSGLINAYKTASSDALTKAKIVTRTVDNIYRISFGYLVMNDIMRIVKDMHLDMVEQQFDNSCYVNISVRQGLSEEFLSRVSKIETVSAEYLSTV